MATGSRVESIVYTYGTNLIPPPPLCIIADYQAIYNYEKESPLNLILKRSMFPTQDSLTAISKLLRMKTYSTTIAHGEVF
jgi:hypothetical protein